MSDPPTYLHTNGALKTMHLLCFLHIKTTARRFSVDNETFDFNKFIAELHAHVEKFSRKTLSNFDQRALAGYEEFARGNQINEKRRNRLPCQRRKLVDQNLDFSVCS